MTAVWILGSCVTRDAFNEDGDGFTLGEYWARTSLGSAFSARPVDSVELDKIASPFQRRMVEADVTFVTAPRTEAYGKVVVFLDLEGNRWDLVGPPSRNALG